MNYQQTIDYLFTALPMYSRIGSAAYKKDLTNIIALCNYLQQPQLAFKSIHIAGTNGKGSVSHMLAAVLQTAGYKTGLYTSPHLYDFRERIRIKGDVIPEAEVVQFVQKIQPVIAAIEPSFFEITVAMAFDFFARNGVDIAVIEVGLGGRLDSTNIITPEIAVITNIGWDHMNMLGNSLPQIAAEKGGIIKENIPVVIGEKKEATLPVFEEIARRKQAPLYAAEDQYRVVSYHMETGALTIKVAETASQKQETYTLDLPGIYQTKNLLTVLQTISLLQQKGWQISHGYIKTALAQVKQRTGLHGRWEVIHRQPMVVMDVAHNTDGLWQLLQHIQQLSYQQLHIVFGMVKDKPAETLLQWLPKEATYYFTAAHIPRALDAHSLQQAAQAFQLQGDVYPNVNTAIQHAVQQASPDDLIIICGSIFLVAEVNKESLAAF